MKVLITGATGLIGSEITRQLENLSIPFHYLTTAPHKIKDEPNCKGFSWDPAKGEIDLAAFEGVTHVINLAGVSIASRWTKAYKKKILDSRVSSLQTLKKAIQKLQSHEIVHFTAASAIGIYPSHLERLYLSEGSDSQSNDDSFETNHGEASFLRQTVLSWEQANSEIKDLGIDLAQLRVGLVMDAKQGALPEFVSPIKWGVGAAFGHGTQWQSWIHIKDIAAMFIYISTQNKVGIYNGVAPNPIQQQDLVRVIAKQLKRPLWLPNVPAFAMRLLLGEMSDLLFESQKVSAAQMIKEGFEFEFQDFSKAIASLYPKK